MKPFRVFVVGTDTGIGKTQVACALLSLLSDRGDQPAPFKPYETGVVPGSEPADAAALREAARSDDDLRLILSPSVPTAFGARSRREATPQRAPCSRPP